MRTANQGSGRDIAYHYRESKKMCTAATRGAGTTLPCNFGFWIPVDFIKDKKKEFIK